MAAQDECEQNRAHQDAIDPEVEKASFRQKTDEGFDRDHPHDECHEVSDQECGHLSGLDGLKDLQAFDQGRGRECRDREKE